MRLAMFGSKRFHGAGEFTLGASVDERTTVFNLGRTAFGFLSEPGAFRGSPTQFAVEMRACEAAPECRFAIVADLATAWHA